MSDESVRVLVLRPTAVKKMLAKRAEAPEGFGPDALERIDEKRIVELIYPVGFYRDKARHLKALPRVLKEKFGGVLPHTAIFMRRGSYS